VITHIQGVNEEHCQIWSGVKVYLVNRDGDIPEDPIWISSGNNTGLIQHDSMRAMLEYWLNREIPEQITTNEGGVTYPVRVADQLLTNLVIADIEKFGKR